MPRLPAQTRDQLLADTRQKLLEAAAAEFAAEGYGGANINRISQNAGLAKGTVYNYFPSKKALLLALIDAVAEAHVHWICQAVREESDPAGRLARFFRAGFAFVERYPLQAQTVINAVYGPDGEFRAQVDQDYEELYTLIAQDILGAGVQAGVFRSVDADLATALIMTVYLGSCSQLDDKGRIWLDPDQIVGMLLDGLRPPA